MSLQPANRHRLMIAHDLRRDHRQHFALRRVDLARHDRAARLVLRQMQLAKAGARA